MKTNKEYPPLEDHPIYWFLLTQRFMSYKRNEEEEDINSPSAFTPFMFTLHYVTIKRDSSLSHMKTVTDLMRN